MISAPDYESLNLLISRDLPAAGYGHVHTHRCGGHGVSNTGNMFWKFMVTWELGKDRTYTNRGI